MVPSASRSARLGMEAGKIVGVRQAARSLVPRLTICIQAGNIWTRHAFCDCPGTAASFMQSGLVLQASRNADADLLLHILLHSAIEANVDATSVRYVGRALASTAEEYV